jgi:hypothetical protein
LGFHVLCCIQLGVEQVELTLSCNLQLLLQCDMIEVLLWSRLG